MRKILITGASGFTGKALCRRLIEEGERVVGFVRPTSEIEELESMGVTCRVVDITRREEVFRNFDGIGEVVHTAAEYRTEHIDKDAFNQVNVVATEHLLQAATAAKVSRFVHLSTVGVQGEIEEPPAGEYYRFKPGDYYQETKLAGELKAREYFSQGLPGAVVRPVGIYGPGDKRFLKLFRSINRGYFVMVGNGMALYHLTYIDDLIHGIILCLRKHEALGRVFTIAGERYTTILELVNTIAEVLGKPHPKVRIPFYPVYGSALVFDKMLRTAGIKSPLYPRRFDFFYKDRAFCISKANRLLGYRPSVGLREGLEKTASWYKQENLL
ncbi:MAG: NAD-dependent epimerase/dehydratase family protein [Deltaproteobacteria bacterium]|nr:NAD-dependent epimerase/dehydratase family protein [Deltaproteobacteria bacterium]